MNWWMNVCNDQTDINTEWFILRTFNIQIKIYSSCATIKHFWPKAYFPIFISKFSLFTEVNSKKIYMWKWESIVVSLSNYTFLGFFAVVVSIIQKIKFFFFLLEIFRFAVIVLHTLCQLLYIIWSFLVLPLSNCKPSEPLQHLLSKRKTSLI